jgi:hypothetical protein
VVLSHSAGERHPDPAGLYSDRSTGIPHHNRRSRFVSADRNPVAERQLPHRARHGLPHFGSGAPGHDAAHPWAGSVPNLVAGPNSGRLDPMLDRRRDTPNRRGYKRRSASRTSAAGMPGQGKRSDRRLFDPLPCGCRNGRSLQPVGHGLHGKSPARLVNPQSFTDPWNPWYKTPRKTPLDKTGLRWYILAHHEHAALPYSRSYLGSTCIAELSGRAFPLSGFSCALPQPEGVSFLEVR